MKLAHLVAVDALHLRLGQREGLVSGLQHLRSGAGVLFEMDAVDAERRKRFAGQRMVYFDRKVVRVMTAGYHCTRTRREPIACCETKHRGAITEKLFETNSKREAG